MLRRVSSKHRLIESGLLTYFLSLDTFYTALDAGEVTAGMVLIFRYQGPKGGPGMPEASFFVAAGCKGLTERVDAWPHWSTHGCWSWG